MADITGSCNSAGQFKRKDEDCDKQEDHECAPIAATQWSNGDNRVIVKRRDSDHLYNTSTKMARLFPIPNVTSPVVGLDGPSQPSNCAQSRGNEDPERGEGLIKKMCGAVRTLLECIGEDPDREGLKATPSRYGKALLFLTKGYQIDLESIVNGALFHEGHNEIVVVKNIDIFSLCEHHLVPFTGKMHIGYIPSNTVIGLSKLPRITEMFSRRLQIQERLTKDVANAIMQILNPQGVAVVMESSHLCMVMRGVEKTGATTVTSCVLGCFKGNHKTRDEFFSLIGVNRT